MWWTNSLCTSANEDLGTLTEYDPLTEGKGREGLDCHRPWTFDSSAEEQISGQQKPRTNPPRKRAWKRALRLLIIAGVCFYRRGRYAVEDGSATMLADPDTLSPLRTTLLQPRLDPPRRASDARVTSANRGTCYVVSAMTVRRSANWTGYLSCAVGHELVGHQLYSCKF